MVHLRGLEPRTHWLRVSCSTSWAKGASAKQGTQIFKILPDKEERKKSEGREREEKKLKQAEPTKGSSPRSISIGQLNTLLYLHLRPIKLVVCKWPYLFETVGYLILKHVSRLDAFSVYHNRTQLPGCAPGGTTGAPEVRPTRSSRTKVSPSQISNAHDR